jgi:uncharacterized protein (DUF305 family)
MAPATQAYLDVMIKMQEQMKSMRTINDASRDFVVMMKPHHQTAIDLAVAYLKYGHDPKLREMSEEIIKGQTREIREMDLWLLKHPS